MTDLLQTYISSQLEERLRRGRIVVWYDPRREFEAFVDELGDGDEGIGPRPIVIGGLSVQLATHDGSLYSARTRVEPLVGGDDPPPVLLYLAGVSRDLRRSVLMELELAGSRWEPQLKQLARNALRQRFTDGVIDELLARRTITYAELVAAADDGGGSAPSVLKTVLHGHTADAQLAGWLASPAFDAQITSREAQAELSKLIRSQLGLELEANDLATWRSVTARYVLAVEFRSDVDGEPPPELRDVPAADATVERNARAIAQALRVHYASSYPELADNAARELGLGASSIDALALGAIDTFRFEEVALAQRCAELLRVGEFTRVCEIAGARRWGYWLLESIERQAQWEAIRLAADLGQAADDIDRELEPKPASPADWVDGYAQRWHELDRCQRHLESWLPKLDDDPDERALAAVRRRYDDVLARLADGFVNALETADWATDGMLHQTSIYDGLVARSSGRVAYFLVDALRYEMGVELAERLEQYGEVTIQPAVTALPSLTKLGMAALMPGAAADYDVAEAGGNLVARVGGADLPNRQTRTSRIQALVPGSADLELEEIHALTKSKLATKIGESQLVIVRSQEIDFFGESGFQARMVMDTVIENVARAVRKLASLGIERAIIAADHGHLYAAEDREEAMRIDAPGGAQVELHRRCWIGRGGSTPPGCVRVPAGALGYGTDLDFVFPRGIGVFRAGGDLAYHHGGPCLQEVVIPVITVRASVATDDGMSPPTSLSVGDIPSTITNRIFSVKVAVASLLGADMPVKLLLLAGRRQAGHVGLAIGGEHDRSTDTVMIGSVGEVTIGFVLDDDQATSVRIVIVDPATEATLYSSPAEIPVELGVR